MCYFVLSQLTLSCRLVFHLLKTPVRNIIISNTKITCNKLSDLSLVHLIYLLMTTLLSLGV